MDKHSHVLVCLITGSANGAGNQEPENGTLKLLGYLWMERVFVTRTYGPQKIELFIRNRPYHVTTRFCLSLFVGIGWGESEYLPCTEVALRARQSCDEVFRIQIVQLVLVERVRINEHVGERGCRITDIGNGRQCANDLADLGVDPGHVVVVVG
ncbi:hypothetical protein D3C84_827870 [compost metagenome]